MSEVAQAPQLRFPEFIGEWDVTNFGNISSIKRGASPRPISSPKWFDKDSSVGWVRISDVTKSKKYLKKTEQYLSEDGINRSRKVDKGNLIMSICATIGKPIYTNFNVCIHDGFIVFDSLSEDKGFIYYLLEKIQKKWYRYGQPGTQVNLNSDIVSSEIFSIPTKPEQQKIAAFLTAVDNKIEQLSKKQELLGEYKKGLMQKIFSQAIRFKADDGGDYPDWEELKLGEVARFRRGSFPQPYGNPEWYDDEDGKPFVQVYDVAGNMRLKSTTKRKISVLAQSSSVFVPKGNVVLTIQGSIGRIALTQYDAYVDRTLLIFTGYIKEVNKQFFIYVIYLLFEIEKIKAPGGTIKTITKEALTSFKLDLPCFDEQTKIANFLSSIDSKIEQVGKQLDKSKQFKKALLQQMFV